MVWWRLLLPFKFIKNAKMKFAIHSFILLLRLLSISSQQQQGFTFVRTAEKDDNNARL